jgi:parallel beta helix pectate lyase-like protein/flagellar hook capping protein FlgD/Big-like domain-containing protein
MALALSTALAASASAQTFYVDNQSAACSNVGTGTELQPYCTIGAAMAAHNGPGVTILVKPGVYREQVTLPASGVSGNPFVIRATGAGVVVDGADNFASSALWTLSSGTTFSAATVTWAPLQVFVDGARLTPSTALPTALPANSFVWVSGQGLYVNLGGGNPGLRQTLVGHRLYGFSMFSKSWITIDGFEVTRQESRGIYMQNPSTDLVIARNKVSFSNGYGIQAVNGARLMIEENVVSECNLHGIGLTAGTNNCTVRYNEAFNMREPSTTHVAGIHLHTAPHNTLYGNRTHHNADSGINFYTASDSCLSYNNRSWSNGDHGFDHLSAIATVHMNDVAYGNDMDGFSIEGTSPNTRLHNCISVNNGLLTDEFDLWVNFESAPGLVSDHNIFWNSTAQTPFKLIATKYATLAEWQAVSGQDAHSRQVDPKFVGGATGNFTLMAGSPAIDAAKTDLSNWPALDVAGNPRWDDPATSNQGVGPVSYADIGALEFKTTATVNVPPVVVAPALMTVAQGATVSFTVTASDLNGDAITKFAMKLSKFPKGNGATFTVNANKTSGVFTWNVASNVKKATYSVTFTATNSLSGSAKTNIVVVAPTLLAGRADASVAGAEAEAEVEGGDPAGVVELSNGFPNPSQGAVEFALNLPRASQVEWTVYDVQGRTVLSQSSAFAAGRAILRWDGRNATGQRAATGIYMVRARVESATFTRRVVRL